MTTAPTPIPPAALLGENKTLLRQAAYYYMETDPEQKRIATETLMRLKFGQYPSALIDAIVQRGPGRQPSVPGLRIFLGPFGPVSPRWLLDA